MSNPARYVCQRFLVWNITANSVSRTMIFNFFVRIFYVIGNIARLFSPTTQLNDICILLNSRKLFIRLSNHFFEIEIPGVTGYCMILGDTFNFFSISAVSSLPFSLYYYQFQFVTVPDYQGFSLTREYYHYKRGLK